MNVNAKEISRQVATALPVWEELKHKWREFGLPGSAFSPDEFIACLLLSQCGIGTDEVAKRITAALPLYNHLKHNTLSGLYGSDSVALLLVAQLAGDHSASELPVQESAAPVLVMEPVETELTPLNVCPHCGHDPELCKDGEYAVPVAPVLETEGVTAPSADGNREEDGKESESCDHVDAHGCCLRCTSEDTERCSGCDEECIASKLKRCADPDCPDSHAYCSNCAPDNLEQGYCEDCRTVTCDEEDCEEEFDRSEGHACGNPDCSNKNVYCDDSAERMLNKDGFCPDCSGEEQIQCNGCEKYFTRSRVTRCVKEDCDRDYCDDCKGNYLDSEGVCEDCRMIQCWGPSCENRILEGQETVCNNPNCTSNAKLCGECAERLLNGHGQCSVCSGEKEAVCDRCRHWFTASRLAECIQCGKHFCENCKLYVMERSGRCMTCTAENARLAEQASGTKQSVPWYKRW